MNTSKQLNRLASQLLGMVLVFSLSACGSGSDSGSGGGIATANKTVVKGNISESSFSGGGGLGGISVRITSRTSTTDSAGGFQLNDVPAGNQPVLFSKNGEQAALTLDIKLDTRMRTNFGHPEQSNKPIED